MRFLLQEYNNAKLIEYQKDRGEINESSSYKLVLQQ